MDSKDEKQLLDDVSTIRTKLDERIDRYDKQFEDNDIEHTALWKSHEKTNNRINAMVATAAVLAVTTAVSVILFLVERMGG